MVKTVLILMAALFMLAGIFCGIYSCIGSTMICIACSVGTMGYLYFIIKDEPEEAEKIENNKEERPLSMLFVPEELN